MNKCENANYAEDSNFKKYAYCNIHDGICPFFGKYIASPHMKQWMCAKFEGKEQADER